MSEPDLYTTEVARIGRKLIGPEWASGLARLTNTNPRTMARIKAAAAQGRPYPAARGVLAALHDELAEILRQLKPHKRP